MALTSRKPFKPSAALAAAFVCATALAGCGAATSDSVDPNPASTGSHSPNQSVTPSNVAFLNNPSIQDVIDIGNYTLNLTGKPFFSNVTLFAANIDGTDPNAAILALNNYFNALLETPTGLAAVGALQAKGVKVQLGLLPNHQNAGWSCPMTTAGAAVLGNAIVALLNTYKLDGVAIDDEYSNCAPVNNPPPPSPSSMYAVAQAIKTNPDFGGKILSKAVFNDAQFFVSPTNMADVLTQGYQMSYIGANVGLLDPYKAAGMASSALWLGLSPQYNNAQDAGSLAASVKNASYAGMMVWSPNTSLTNLSDGEAYYTSIAQGQSNADAKVTFVPTVSSPSGSPGP